MLRVVVSVGLLAILSCNAAESSTLDRDSRPTANLDASAQDASDTGSHDLDHASYVPSGLRPTAAARLVVMGDSISWGFGASEPTLEYGRLLYNNDDSVWPSASTLDLRTFFGNDLEFVTVAKSGSTTSNLVVQQRADLESILGETVAGHTIVVLTSGGNDLLDALRGLGDPTAEPLDTATANLEALADYFADEVRFPDGVSLYVASVYDPTDGEGKANECFAGLVINALESWLETWRGAYQRVAEDKGFAMIDALGHFRGHGFHRDDPSNPYYDQEDPSLWMYDCIHPNDRGHHELRRLFFEAIHPDYTADD